MLFFFIYCFSFLLLSNFSSFTPFKNHTHKLHRFFSPWIKHRRILIFKKFTSSKVVNFEETALLDLPDLALDSILEKLSPAELCSMAGVCKNLRHKCKSDHLWNKHMTHKWGRLIGDAAYKQWHCIIDSSAVNVVRKSSFSCLLDNLFSSRSKMDCNSKRFLQENSIMACYLALETGKFWFPAQVYNREVQNGHIGFMLSCYDAQVCYDSKENNFVASYAAHGSRTVEENIEWNRLRPPPVDTPPNVLHISDCLDDLRPDDHIEIQWRKKKEFPYGWWYGVVGHLETCNGHDDNCMCHMSDVIILEFKQYIPGSQWRRTEIERKDHKEVGNEGDGFYGGIRKLYNKEEIETWKHFWTNCMLE